MKSSDKYFLRIKLKSRKQEKIEKLERVVTVYSVI